MPTAPLPSPKPPPHLDPYIREAAYAHGVPYRLLVAILWVESRFRPEIIAGTLKSTAGAVGIAQFMPTTAAALGIDPLQPDQAIMAAARYLSQLHFRFGDWRMAAAAYNCGPSRLAENGMAGIPSETRNYLRLVETAL